MIVNGTQMYEDAIRRIRELEQLNSLLAEQVDRQSAVVDAVLKWKRHKFSLRDLELVTMTYERDMAQLNKGERER